MKKDVFRKGIVIAIFILFITVTACHPIGEIPPPQHEQLVHNEYLSIGCTLNNKPGLNDSFELLFNRSINLLMRMGQIYSLSICLIKNNTIAWSNGYGIYDMEKNQKPNVDTCYLIASISKTITATAILQLYEQGLFELDDNVNNKLDFDIYNPSHPEVNITYRMLLNHTASLDIESADFLNDIMDVYKISSSDLTNKPFIEYICQFQKPIILSTGASSLHEIQEAVSWIEKFGNPLSLLHCVLNYPTADKNANLGMILDLKQKFPDKIIGYSDHTLPKDMKVCEIAIMLGCVIIEKHFTHDKTLSGNDHYHAMDKDDLKIYLSNLERTFEILGNFQVLALEDEAPARANARRSLVANRNIPVGKTITKDDLTFKRPAHGVSPKFIDDILGKVASKDINNDDVIQWNMFE